MAFVLEPSCAIGDRVANLGGTVLVGRDGGLELAGGTIGVRRAA